MLPDTESEPLPGLYAQWITELLGGAIPRESRATRDACAMCAREGQESASASYFFDPVVKCCSYVPDLHNFLVGRILSDTDPAAQHGRATVEKRIAAAIGVTPLWLKQPPVYALLYEGSSEAFGRSRTLRCPHYLEDGNLCGIWRNREFTCATWFCKHVRGDVGYRFWRDSLHRVLRAVETELARWCVLEIQLGDGEVMDTLHLARSAGLEAEPAAWDFLLVLLKFLESHWEHPDEGLWEVRGRPRQFTHSKVMAWVAFDRAITDAEAGGLEGPIERWRQLRDAIHAQVCEKGFDARSNSFVQAYDSPHLDASLLLIPQVGFLPPDDLARSRDH